MELVTTKAIQLEIMPCKSMVQGDNAQDKNFSLQILAGNRGELGVPHKWNWWLL